MLDVYPPEHTPHTWRDFLIHIATIVVGLCIAIGLEQSVEAVHRHQERKELLQDLRDEATLRLPLIEANEKNFAITAAWYRGCLESALRGVKSDGFVQFNLPVLPERGDSVRPEDAVWPAAKDSGKVAVLSTAETEGWGRVDYWAAYTQRSVETWLAASDALHALAEGMGISLTPGATIRITTAQRDVLTHALGTAIETEERFASNDAAWYGTSDAALHRQYTTAAMAPFYGRAESKLLH